MTHARSDLVHSLLLGTTCLAGLAMAWPAYAGGPSGATVVSGSATVSNPNSSTTVINQTSEKTLINWQDFSIPKGHTVTFNQPNSSAIALNCVTGPNASSIYGNLTANGNVWLINSNVGPRSVDRGNDRATARTSLEVTLQWGRDQLIAELCRSRLRGTATSVGFNGAAIS